MRHYALMTALAIGLLLGACIHSIPNLPAMPGVVTLFAQSLPSVRPISWIPSVSTLNVVSYSVVLDGGAPIVLPVTASLCTSTLCSSTLSVPTNGPHTWTVAGTNSALTGDPVTVGTTPQTGPFAAVVNFILNAQPGVIAGLGIK